MKVKSKTIKSNEGNIFLRRLSFYLKKGSLKLHVITGDDSAVYHTHPWDFKSFILFGGYREHVETREQRCQVAYDVHRCRDYRMFSVNTKKHNERHRVELYKLFGINNTSSNYWLLLRETRTL